MRLLPRILGVEAQRRVGMKNLGNREPACDEWPEPLHTLPACAPVNASRAALRLYHTHDSEPAWLARPSPYGSFIHTCTPVYPGALLPVLRATR
jgi:hypothetical protein